MTDVFVSYKAEDRARVAPLVRALENDGVSVWWDEHIGAGDEWRETILRHLESARAVIVIWSRRSVGRQGQFVRDEASRAVKRKTYLPIRIDKVDPPLGFGETQAHDLAGWKGEITDARYQAIGSALRDRFGIETRKATSKAERSDGIDRRGVIAGAAVAGVGAAGVGVWLWSAPSSAKDNSIAVMPFENLSGNPAETYFSDGIAEELRSALSRIPGLKVVARTSSEAVSKADAVTAATKLHVSDILTGSVRRSPDMLRITAQLIDGKEGTQRWSEAYDRPIGDSLKIQSEIAAKVAEALRLRIGPVDKELRLRGGTDNPRAQDFYLRSEAVRRNADSEAGIREALGLVEAALTEDPKYGDAITSKANRLGQLASTYAVNAAEAQAMQQQSRAAASLAVQFAPLSTMAHRSLGTSYYWAFDFIPALREFSRFLSLSGQNGEDVATIGWMFSMLRRFDVAMRMADQAAALDPLNASVHRNRANVLLGARRLDEAEQAIQRAIQLNASLWYSHLVYAQILFASGRVRQAQQEIEQAHHDSMSIVALHAAIAERLGDHGLAEQMRQAIEHSEVFSAAHYQVAQIYAQQGRTGEALSELEGAWTARDPGLAQLQTDILFDSIRAQPGFQDFLKRMRFPA